MSALPKIIGTARASLEASITAAIFVVTGGLSLAFLAVLSPCAASTTTPIIPICGSLLYLIVILPTIGITLAMSAPKDDSMTVVPEKNDETIVFSRKEGVRLSYHTAFRALPAPIIAQILHLIVFGELVASLDPLFVENHCGVDFSGDGILWLKAIRCSALAEYEGDARYYSGAIMLAEMTLCVLISSAGFVFRTKSILEERPWRKNRIWAYCVFICMLSVVITLALVLKDIIPTNLPWYFYLISIIAPFISLATGEFIKSIDSRHATRAERLRRLQFETRLGMWSPK